MYGKHFGLEQSRSEEGDMCLQSIKPELDGMGWWY